MAGNIVTRVGKGSQLTFTELDNNFKVLTNALNALGAGITIDAGPLPVPGILTAPSFTGTAGEGLLLTGTRGTYSNSPTSYANQWQVSANGGTTWTNITGATSLNYTLTASEVGKIVRPTEYAINGTGSSLLNVGTASTTVSPATNLMLYTEGDSITANPGPTWATIYAAANPGLAFTNAAVPGDTLNNLLARRNNVLTADPRFFAVLVGANDLDDTNTYPTTQDYINAVFAYLAPIRAGGAKVAVGTILERASRPTINSRRATYNAAIKAAIGNQLDAVMDNDRTAVGAVGASADATLIPDGTHPSANPGQIIMSGPATGAINFMRGITNQPFQFTFIDVSGVPASTVSTSNKIRITGLNYQETKTASVTGGEMRVTPFGGVAGSWITSNATVYEGDDIEVRGTSNSIANGTTNVVLTVGTTTDTYTITTANNLPPLTIVERPSGRVDGLGFGSTASFTGIQTYTGVTYVGFKLLQGSLATATVTLNGVTGTIKYSGNQHFWFEFLGMTAGTGKTLAISGATGGLTAVGYGMWTAEANARYVAGSGTGFTNGGASPTDTSILTVPSGGGILASALVNTSSADLVPTSGVTEFSDVIFNGYEYWEGSRATTGSIGFTAGMQFTGGLCSGIVVEPT